MEVIQGKSTNKKIVIAQEIAFAKVLAGNNKTLRDRAVKKLKKWLTIRGNGKWTFAEEEFMRIWTGLFYCMWMSDKFLIQEELAESISRLIHCFKKSSESALMFIKCFNKRILMDWEGLDQYRVDKFNMLIRRFLRQTFVYCKEKNWEESLLHKLMGIFYNIVLHRDNSLGFVMHFISIYPEELAKVSKGKISTKTVITVIQPFVKLIARSNDIRIQKEAEDLFMYLMRQTDTGIEFEEKFNAWKEQGFPGAGPHCMKTLNIPNGNNNNNNNEDDSFCETDDEDLNSENEPLDPRAGSVHVLLPQIPIDINGILNLFRKHQHSKFANPQGRRILKSLTQKYETLNKGRFPMKVKKDPVLSEKKKKKQTARNASKLLRFTQEIDQKSIQTEEYNEMLKELEEDVDQNFNNERGNYDSKEETNKANQNKKAFLKVRKVEKVSSGKKKTKKKSTELEVSSTEIPEIKKKGNYKENCNQQKKKRKKKNRKQKKEHSEQSSANEKSVIEIKQKEKIKTVLSELQQDSEEDSQNNMSKKAGRKRKTLSSWHIEDLDSSSPEYYKIETPKIIRLEKKLNGRFSFEENESEKKEAECMEHSTEETTKKEEIFPIFWEKARAKVNQKSGKKSKVFVNPFANTNGESKTLGRRISFALDKNMAQENEQYLEEVKNSPRVPFDGSKKPIQSALKSGLAPSPVNPFYRLNKIRF